MHIKYHFMRGLFQENLAQTLLIQPGMYSSFEVTAVTVTFSRFAKTFFALGGGRLDRELR